MSVKTSLIISGAIIILSSVIALALYTRNPGQGGPAAAVAFQGRETDTMPPESYRAAIENGETTVIDVRTPHEYASAHIDGAQNIDFYSVGFPEKIGELDRNAKYAIYCRSGSRSGQTLELMRRMGFTDVMNLEGGLDAWVKAGYPVSR